MDIRLPDSFHTGETLVLTCAEEHAYPAAWKPVLRDRAIVLRTHDGSLPSAPDNPLALALRRGTIRRVVVLAHTPCHGLGWSRSREPIANTAAITSWHSYAEPARQLAGRLGRGKLSSELFAAQLDALVQLANLRACAELHEAVEQGRVSVYAAVYDATRDRVELFDDSRFRSIDPERFCRFLAGTTGPETRQRANPAGAHHAAVHVPAGAVNHHLPDLGVQPGGLA